MLNNKSIQISKTIYFKLTFLKKNFKIFKTYANNI